MLERWGEARRCGGRSIDIPVEKGVSVARGNGIWLGWSGVAGYIGAEGSSATGMSPLRGICRSGGIATPGIDNQGGGGMWKRFIELLGIPVFLPASPHKGQDGNSADLKRAQAI